MRTLEESEGRHKCLSVRVKKIIIIIIMKVK